MKRHMDECRAWLESCGEMLAEVQRLKQRHARLLEQATKVTTHLSMTPGGGGGDKDRDRVLAALADADADVLARMAEAETRAQEIEHFIDRLSAPASRMILRYRYVDRLGWRAIARRMSYSESNIYKLHGEALNEARALWEDWKHG